MNAQQKVAVAGYRQIWGTKQVNIFEVAGPASYPTGGQTVNATDLGVGGMDYMDVGTYSYSGTYKCTVQPLPTSAAPSKQKPAIKSFKILWYVVATNAEVANTTDLSGEIVRLIAIGD